MEKMSLTPLQIEQPAEEQPVAGCRAPTNTPVGGRMTGTPRPDLLQVAASEAAARRAALATLGHEDHKAEL